MSISKRLKTERDLDHVVELKPKGQNNVCSMHASILACVC